MTVVDPADERLHRPMPWATGTSGATWRPSDAHAYERDPAGFLSAAVDRCGDTFRFGRNAVFVADPDEVHTVLTGTGREFRTGRDILDGFRGNPDEITALWLRGRRAGRAGLAARAASAGAHRMHERIRTDLAALAGRPVDVADHAPGLCSRAALAHCLATVPDELPARLATAAERLTGVLDATLPFPAWVPGSAAHRARASVRALAGVLTEVVEERGRRRGHGGTEPGPDDAEPGPGGEAGHDEPDLLDALLTDADASAREARAALQMIITGTHVVPGAALTWLMAELATRKGLSESIRAEVAAHGTTGDLPYTTAVVKESLRLHPPVWLMTRDVALPTRIAGHAVGPGDQVVFSPYLLQRDPRRWDAPDRFRPERWLDEPHPRRTRHAWIPFSGGTRICAGYRLGLLQLTLTAALLATEYTVETVGDIDLTPTYKSVLTPTDLRMRWDPKPPR
ncbi:cytochrome P450 [Streptomyces sp. NPDC006435]|uniref:cytochrome P450 n=1 Tax=Streptomyces sp. NPDC006435 TaxID=3154300 RepID=UPI0033A450FA